MPNIEHEDAHMELAKQLTPATEYLRGPYSRPLVPLPTVGYVLTKREAQTQRHTIQYRYTRTILLVGHTGTRTVPLVDHTSTRTIRLPIVGLPVVGLPVAP